MLTREQVENIALSARVHDKGVLLHSAKVQALCRMALSALLAPSTTQDAGLRALLAEGAAFAEGQRYRCKDDPSKKEAFEVADEYLKRVDAALSTPSPKASATVDLEAIRKVINALRADAQAVRHEDLKASCIRYAWILTQAITWIESPPAALQANTVATEKEKCLGCETDGLYDRDSHAEPHTCKPKSQEGGA